MVTKIFDVPSQSTRRKYHTLDGIRGAAALVVLMRHLGFYFKDLSLYISKAESYLAVDLFFVLSGFVIAGAYDKRLSSGLSPIEFIKIRVIRLYPLYLLGLLVGTISAVFSIFGNNTVGLTGPEIMRDFAFALFMLPTPFLSVLYPLNAPSYSLFYELISNSLYSFAYPILTVGKLIFVLAIAGIGLGLSAFQVGDLNGGSTWTGLITGVLRVIYSFSAGLLIYRFHTKISILRLPSWILIGFVLLSLSVTPSVPLRPWYDMVIVIFFFPLIVQMASVSEPRSEKVVKVYQILGTTSYAIYILHRPVAPLIAQLFLVIFKHPVSQFAPFSGFVFLLGFIFGCLLLDRIYDLPARHWATSIFLKKQRS